MRAATMMRSTGMAVAAAIALAAGAAAQSLTSVQGPGYPLLPNDARTAVLGGIGVGLHGMALPLSDPASVGRALRRGGLVSLESVERGVRVGDAEDRIGTTRFPLLRFIYPVGGTVLTASYGGFLDQSWALVREGEQALENSTVGFRDVMQSVGGVGQFQVGAARRIGERLAIGAVVGAHTGTQRVTFQRSFDTTAVGLLEPYRETMAWRYMGPMAQVGVSWDALDMLRVGASVSWAGTLAGDSVEGRVARREVELPLQVAGGASAFLVPGLMGAVSARWSGWSVTDPLVGVPPPGDAAPGTRASRDTWEVGGGLEWINPIRVTRRAYPLRAGFQYRQLPFPYGGGVPSEWFAGGGVGLRVGTDPGNPLAIADVAIQHGRRTATGNAQVGDLTESMWRLSLSLSVFGN